MCKVIQVEDEKESIEIIEVGARGKKCCGFCEVNGKSTCKSKFNENKEENQILSEVIE